MVHEFGGDRVEVRRVGEHAVDEYDRAAAATPVAHDQVPDGTVHHGRFGVARAPARDPGSKLAAAAKLAVCDVQYFALARSSTTPVIGQCLPRHRHNEFLKFLQTIDRQVPRGLRVHLILDNYATHNHPNVKTWLAKHPASSCASPTTSSSWLNMVEIFFGRLTDKAIRRGVFHSVPDLIAAIETYLNTTNESPTPFVWTATTDQILDKVRRGRVSLNQPANQN